MMLIVELGEHRCSATTQSSSGSNNEVLCALKDSQGDQVLPPVKITVNFGDGSGEQDWTREDPRDLWTHQYQFPGRYTVSVVTINEYDFTQDAAWLEVEVVAPVEDTMGLEVVCPPVVTPGEYFVCTADIPMGTDLLFTLDMVDDLDSTITTLSGEMAAPDPFLHIPGGSLKHRSWNKTTPHLVDTPSVPPGEFDNYILRSTQFQYQTNLSGLAYVAATSGKLLVDILRPKCPMRVDPFTRELVETYWCPITGACESNCYSSMQMAPDWFTEWGPEWACKGTTLDFCSLEGMCNYPDSCALSPSGEFGGSSVDPHVPKNITDLSESAANPPDTAEALWNYNITQTIEITVQPEDLWTTQFLPFLKEFWFDPEREQDRKAHVEM